MVPFVSLAGRVESASTSITTVIATPSEKNFASKKEMNSTVTADADAQHANQHRPSIAPPRANQMTMVEAVGLLIV